MSFPKKRKITLLRRVHDQVDVYAQRDEEWETFGEWPDRADDKRCLSSIPTGRIYERTRRVPTESPLVMREGEVLVLHEPSFSEMHVFKQTEGDADDRPCEGVCFAEKSLREVCA